MESKTCTRCKRSLPLDRFAFKGGRPGQAKRRSSRCKECVNFICRTKYYPNYDRKKPKQPKDTSPPTTKRCPDCDTEKPIAEFHPNCKNPSSAWHWQTYCKPCDAKRHREKARAGYKRPEPDLAMKLLESKLKTTKAGRTQRHRSSKRLSMNLTANEIRGVVQSQTKDGKLFCAATGVELCDRSTTQKGMNQGMFALLLSCIISVGGIGQTRLH